MLSSNTTDRNSRFVPPRKGANVWRVSNYMKDRKSMNAQSSMTHQARTMQTIPRLNWKNIDWKQARIYVNRLQVRIVKAVQKGKWRLVKRIQKLLTNSFYAKALAVKKVVSNKGKNTPGIDGVLWKSDKDKTDAIYALNTKTYKAKPLRRTYIEKYGKKEKRPLGIPTMKDRAMQGLQLLALEPVAETTADRVSFGFRKYRCAQDAMEYIFKLLSRRVSPEWILEGDIKGCFENISHDWMLNNIPADKKIMEQFLKCGYVDKHHLYPTDSGSPQGGLISPAYANQTLDGLELILRNKYSTSATGHFNPNYNKYKVHLCRYADDFIVTANCEAVLYEVKQLIIEFLSDRGLRLSEEKTAITNIKDGFDFLGWNFRKFRGKLLIQPSAKSKKKITRSLSNTVKEFRTAKQESLIVKLNQITKGWAEYHHCVCAKAAYALIDHRLWEMLWKWAKRRHPRKCKKWIKSRYWKNRAGRQWSFCTDKVVLYQMMDMPIVRIKSLNLSKNPFLDADYFVMRKEKHKCKRGQAFLNSAAARNRVYVL